MWAVYLSIVCTSSNSFPFYPRPPDKWSLLAASQTLKYSPDSQLFRYPQFCDLSEYSNQSYNKKYNANLMLHYHSGLWGTGVCLHKYSQSGRDEVCEESCEEAEISIDQIVEDTI